MPAKVISHNNVRNALAKDGWNITRDPLRIRLLRGRNLFVDLGAERLFIAERETEKIAIEVKSFRRTSTMRDLEEAVGQFVLYDRLLKRYYPEYNLYLAVTERIYRSVFLEEAGQILLEDGTIRLVTFHPVEEVIVRWIP